MILDRAEDFFLRFDLDEYLLQIKVYPSFQPYNTISPGIMNTYDKLLKSEGADVTERCHQLVLIHLILKNLDMVSQDYPGCIADWFFKRFNRILKDIENQTYGQGFYLFSNDPFMKDLAVCNLQLIPAGNHKFEVSSFSRRFLIENGVTQFIDAAFFIFFKSKGNQPFYQFHTDIHDRDALKECNLDGTVKLYWRLAKLLERKSDIKGVFGSSWMNDPQLESISPTIFSGPKIVRDNGGKLYYNGTYPDIVKGATYASPKRTRLVKEGKYKPANYMLIWLRDDIIQWARKLDQAF